jgi:hypothetical protein
MANAPERSKIKDLKFPTIALASLIILSLLATLFFFLYSMTVENRIKSLSQK